MNMRTFVASCALVAACSAYGADKYCIVDLSGGPSAKAYAVTYVSDVPSGGWGCEHQTDKLVLRRIDGERPYYIGVFEVTQRQYAQVMGKNPSMFKGDRRPVEMMTWEGLRGPWARHPWPKEASVADDLFFGRLRARTGLDFDLPTEAQWEKACCAGQSVQPELSRSGRFVGNRMDGRGGFGEHTNVGLYEPNAWGLYDMCGNVWEWCLDGKNGASSTPFRMMRGGCWASPAETCTAYYRNAFIAFSWRDDAFYGFRVVLNVPDDGAKALAKPAAVRTVCPNPIVPEGKFLADPSGRVGPDGHLVLFCSHDESAKYYCSTQNDVLETSDLGQWTHHEGVFRTAMIGKNVFPKLQLFAPDGIFHDGKWRLVYCTPDANRALGVATSDKVSGPYGDAHGFGICRQFDPSVFRDDDGTLYLYWGQFSLKCAKLKPDLSGIEPETLHEAILDAQHHHFHEGAQAFKRNGVYYLSFTDVSRSGGGNCIGYATGPTPFGPFTYRGVVIDNDGGNPGHGNNHGSVVEFGGSWYVFYHRHSNAAPSLRKACVEPIFFDADGLIREAEMTSNGAGAPLDPFNPVEARLACVLQGNVRVTTLPDGQERLTGIRDGDTALWRYFDVKRSASILELEAVSHAETKVTVADAAGKPYGAGTVPAGDGRTLAKAAIRLSRPIAPGRSAVKLLFNGESKKDLLDIESFVLK